MENLFETDEPVFIFTNRMALTVPGDTMYEVHPYHKAIELDEDKEETTAFLKGQYVYIYRGSTEHVPKADRLCGLYVTPSGKHIFVDPKTDYEKDVFHISKIAEINPQSMLRKIEENFTKLMTKEDIERVNSSGNVLKVKIEESDDFLKRAIKEVMKQKNVSLKAYEHRTDKDKPYHVSNLRSALTKPNQRMTVNRFTEWVEMLDLDWELKITEAHPDTAFSPLPKPVIIKRSDFD